MWAAAKVRAVSFGRLPATHSLAPGASSSRREFFARRERQRTRTTAMSTKPPIVISRLDLNRIEALLERMPPAQAEGLAALRDELERAEVREPQDMPADVGTMNSRVTAQDEGNGERLELTLVYPSATGAAGQVSVLAPVGSALLGMAKG